MELDTVDISLLIYVLWKTILGVIRTDFDVLVSPLFEETSDRIQYQQQLIKGENALIIRELVEMDRDNFTEDLKIKSTEKVKNLLKEYGIQMLVHKENRII